MTTILERRLLTLPTPQLVPKTIWLAFSKPEYAIQETRKRTLEGVTFYDFTPEQEIRTRNLLESTGLPLNNVSGVNYAPTPDNRRNRIVLAQCEMATGHLTFFKSMEALPERAQMGVGVHELAHENSPFSEKNNALYSTENLRAQAMMHAINIADQSLQTNVYFDSYHKFLAQEYKEGKISRLRFCEETHAIMIELRFTNTKHLEQVQNAQLAKGGTRRILSRRFDGSGQFFAEGVDKTLLSLMPQFRNVAQLDAHIAGLKSSLSVNSNPFGK
ncbi:hypothetical protein HY345_01655 [Candidatus Microgenomates bacterium]|nr:hypothetical protein [Candidatus Microgenomates bacterium]